MRAEYARCTMRAKGWRASDPCISASPSTKCLAVVSTARFSRFCSESATAAPGSWARRVPRAAHWRHGLEQTRQQAISVERRGKVLGRGKAPLRFGLMAGPAVSAGHEENRDARGGGIPAHLVGQRKATAIGKSRVQDDGIGRPHGQCPPGPGQLGLGREQVVRFPSVSLMRRASTGLLSTTRT